VKLGNAGGGTLLDRIKLLSRLGYEYRKPKGLPRVASEEKQAEFIALYERLLNGLGADDVVYFADAVHPEYQTKPSYGWVKAGSNPAVTTTAGRGRVNIHGALNLENFDAPFVEPTTVDEASSAQLLAKIEADNPLSRTRSCGSLEKPCPTNGRPSATRRPIISGSLITANFGF
jgi:hypothetical protein